MKIYAGVGLLILTLSSASFAWTDQCPPTLAFRHLTEGGDWVVANEYNAKGWYVSQTPQAQNAIVHITDSSKLKVILDANNDRNIFEMECEYQLNPTTPNLVLKVYKNAAQSDPADNPQFKQIGKKRYKCITTISNPENCVSVQE
jgi:hypothetical protein